MSDLLADAERGMTKLFEGLGRREQIALLGRLEKAGGALYRALAADERNALAREKLLAAAADEERNGSLLVRMSTPKGECERCDAKLAPEAGHACSFQCTFCDACTHELASVCPNCKGLLEARASDQPIQSQNE